MRRTFSFWVVATAGLTAALFIGRAYGDPEVTRAFCRQTNPVDICDTCSVYLSGNTCYAYECEGGDVTQQHCQHTPLAGRACVPSGPTVEIDECGTCQRWNCDIGAFDNCRGNVPNDPNQSCRCPDDLAGENVMILKARELCTSG